MKFIFQLQQECSPIQKIQRQKALVQAYIMGNVKRQSLRNVDVDAHENVAIVQQKQNP
jgi:hypothetical protein